MERELWKILSRIIRKLDRRFPLGRRTHSVGRVLRVYLWAVLHDRPVYWACKQVNWVGVKSPSLLPDQSTMSRRLFERDTQRMLELLAAQLAGPRLTHLVRYLDGKPLTVSRHSCDTEAKFGRGAGGKARGYKLHAIYAENNRPVAWTVTPLNCSEHKTAASLLGIPMEPGYLLADASYDANSLYEKAGQMGQKLVTPRRYRKAKGLGHRRHSEYRIEAIDRLNAPSSFAKDLLETRRIVETRFAHLTNFGGGLTCLPPWVRRLRRVKNWVAGKIVIRLARDVYLRTSAA